MKFNIEKFVLFAFALFALAFLSIILYFIVPADSIRSLLALAAMLLIVFSGIILNILALSGIIEILTSKNEIAYKVLWILVILSLNVLGYLVFYFVARKDLK